MVFRDIDKNILGNLEDEHEFQSTIVESEEMQPGHKGLQ